MYSFRFSSKLFVKLFQSFLLPRVHSDLWTTLLDKTDGFSRIEVVVLHEKKGQKNCVIIYTYFYVAISSKIKGGVGKVRLRTPLSLETKVEE